MTFDMNVFTYTSSFQSNEGTFEGTNRAAVGITQGYLYKLPLIGKNNQGFLSFYGNEFYQQGL